MCLSQAKTTLMVNQIFSLSGSRSIRFFEAGGSAKHMISLSRSRPMMCFEIGSLVNYLFLLFGSDVMGFFHSSVSSNQTFKVVVPIV
jgi:hypothetical protein